MKKSLTILAILVLLLLVTQMGGQQKRYWVLRGFGMPLVQCDLHGNTVTHCQYLSEGPHQLDGVMTAVFRSTQAKQPEPEQ